MPSTPLPPGQTLPFCCATLLTRLLPPINTTSCTGPLTKIAPLHGGGAITAAAVRARPARLVSTNSGKQP